MECAAEDVRHATTTMKRLSDFSAGRDNNFNLLRFIAASAVLVSHSFALATGDPHTEPLRQLLGLSLGDIAVGVFFVTSGFLVTGSLLTKQNTAEFLLSRALRIYPGLWVAVLLSVAIFGLAYTELGASSFFTQRGTWRYVVTNMAMLGYETYGLPGTFVHLPMAGAVNGSLWSLPVEIRMYMLLGLAWIACSAASRKPARWLKAFCIAVAAVAMAADLAFMWAHPDTYQAYQAPLFADLLAAFFSGAALRALQHRVPVSRTIFAALIGALIVAAATSGFLVLYKLTFAYIVLYVALVPHGPMLKFNRLGDYSYGIYIYAFAVQQTIVHSAPGITPMQLMFFSSVPTLILAMASWHLIEKRALRLRTKYATPPAKPTCEGGSTRATPGLPDLPQIPPHL